MNMEAFDHYQNKESETLVKKVQTSESLESQNICEIPLLNLIYKKRAKPLPPLCEELSYCKQNYKLRKHETKSSRQKVVRRTLTPLVPYQYDYVEETPGSEPDKKCESMSAALRSLTCPPQGKNYAEIRETDGKALLIAQLSPGLTDENITRLNQLYKKTDPAELERQRQRDKEELMKAMRAHRRKECCIHKKNLKPSHTLRHTKNSLQEGKKKMYELLHETEHRLLAVQAGSTYLEHVSSCKRRRNFMNRLLKKVNLSLLNPKPAVTSSGNSLAAIRRRKANSDNPRLTIKDVVESSNFADATRLVRRRQLFYEKCACIYVLLCTLLNMKPPKPGQASLPWNIMKQLREDPYEHIQLSVPSAEEEDSIKLGNFKSYKKADRTKAKPSNSSILPPVVTKSPNRTKTNAVKGKRKSILRKQEPPRSPVAGSKVSVIRGVSGKKDSDEESAYEDGAFESSTISWDEFLKWGDKKKKPLSTKDQTKQTNVVSVASRDLTNKNVFVHNHSGGKYRNSVPNLWKILKKPFLKAMVLERKESKTAEKNRLLMQKLGLDHTNPVSGMKLNWMRTILRGNKMLMKDVVQKEREAVERYNKVKSSKEISDTSKWRHTWALEHQMKNKDIEKEKADQYLEFMEKLTEEASIMSMSTTPVIKNILHKIKLVCLHDRIKYMTRYKGQAYLNVIIMSLPAFELCTYEMQSALQFVVVDILNVETEIMFPMFKQRGLPVHPALLEEPEDKGLNLAEVKKVRIKNHIVANRILSSVPPDRAGMSRDLLKRLNDYSYL